DDVSAEAIANRLRRWRNGERLDRIGKSRRAGLRSAEGSDEPLDEALCFLVTTPGGTQRVGQQLQMLVKRPRDAHQTAIDFHQIVEVNRPFLVVSRDLVDKDRVNRLAYDCCLEKRARIETNDGGAVVHRIEVVVLRFVVDGMRAPEGDVPVPREI